MQATRTSALKPMEVKREFPGKTWESERNWEWKIQPDLMGSEKTPGWVCV